MPVSSVADDGEPATVGGSAKQSEPVQSEPVQSEPMLSGPMLSGPLVLSGALCSLRPATDGDVPALAAIRAMPEVRARWRGEDDASAEIRESIAEMGARHLAIVVDGRAGEPGPAGRAGEAIAAGRAGEGGPAGRDGEPGPAGRVAGVIQWAAEEEPDYRHASIDIYLDPAVHGRGIGTDAVRTLATHLIEVEGFHRLVIDPAADNAAAIRCYAKVGFRPVGIMRQYERGADGTWHGGLLMDLLAAELIR